MVAPLAPRAIVCSWPRSISDQVKLSADEAAGFYRRLARMRPRPIPRSESAGLARQTAVWTFGRGKGPGSLVVWKRGDAPGDAEPAVGEYAGANCSVPSGLEFVEGRAFQAADRIGSLRVAVVNDVYARQAPGGRAMGQTIRVRGYSRWDRRSSAESFAAGREVEIVGVIESADEPRRHARNGTPVAKIPPPVAVAAGAGTHALRAHPFGRGRCRARVRALGVGARSLACLCWLPGPSRCSTSVRWGRHSG